MIFGRTRYSITSPADVADLDSTIYLLRQVFGEGVIDTSAILEANRRNPYTHLIVKDEADEVCGYIDHYLIKPFVMDDFLAGVIVEGEFATRDMLAYGSEEADNRMYIGGIAAFGNASFFEKGRLTQILTYAFARMVKHAYADKGVTMEAYATGFSAEGVKLLKRMGFEMVDDGALRKDKFPLFRKVFEPAGLEAFLKSSSAVERFLELRFR